MVERQLPKLTICRQSVEDGVECSVGGGEAVWDFFFGPGEPHHLRHDGAIQQMGHGLRVDRADAALGDEDSDVFHHGSEA